MDDGQSPGGPGEGDIQGAKPLGMLPEDPGRLDDDGTVHLEALDELDRYDGHLCVEAMTGRSPEWEARPLQGVLHLGGLGVGCDNGQVSSPTASNSKRIASARPSRPEPLSPANLTKRGGSPSALTERGGARSGAASASTPAARSMRGPGIR